MNRRTDPIDWLLTTNAPGWSILVRLLVGLIVFFPEGIQKLIFPALLGEGRFAHIGIPYPEAMGPFVGVIETLCGALIVIGFVTRLAAIPLIIIMIVAIVSTKIPILLGHDFWLFHAPKLARYGFWSMAHEARTDFRHAAGRDLPADRRRRPLVGRCGDRGQSLASADIAPRASPRRCRHELDFRAATSHIHRAYLSRDRAVSAPNAVLARQHFEILTR